MKVLAIGDTHGDTSAICNVALPKARKNDCEIIIQCGDFGYFEHMESGKRFLNKVSKALVREDITMFWIDGNHENHPLLWEKYPAGPGASQVTEIRENLFYMPRGSIMSLDGVRCMFMGGAYSIDKDWRIQEDMREAGILKRDEYLFGRDYSLGSDFEHKRWWPTELITDSEVERAIRHFEEDGPVDLMFTHDVPKGLDVPGIHAEQKQTIWQSEANRDMLTKVFKVVQPKMLVHGHYHVRYTDKLPLFPKVGNGDLLEWDYCRVDGLACNGMHGFAVVLDLDSLFVTE